MPNPPPVGAMRDFYRVHPAFRLTEDGLVSRAPSYPWDDDPTTVQRALVDILRAHRGSIAADVDIRAAADMRGLNRGSVSTYLQYGDQIRRVAPNIYAPVGTSVDQGILEEVQADRQASTIRTEVRHRYDPATGLHILDVVLGTTAAISGVLVLPPEVRAVLPERRYALGGARLGLSESFLYGLGPAVNKMRARGGECLRLTLDPRGRVATLERAEFL